MLITLHSNGYEVAVNTMGAEFKSFKDPSGKECLEFRSCFLDAFFTTSLSNDRKFKKW